MGYSTVESVASFSIVLAEAFAAVGLSTVAPAAAVTIARAAKAAAVAASKAAADTPNTDLAASSTAASSKNTSFMGAFKGMPGPTEKVGALIGAIASEIDELHLLVPKKAKIYAEFEFQGSDSMSASVGGGGTIQMVSVNAGYAALYSTTSKNKITLDVDFEIAKFDI